MAEKAKNRERKREMLQKKWRMPRLGDKCCTTSE
jgi:hypothetical protein